MENQDPLPSLRSAYHVFRNQILSLSDVDFLSLMGGWSPRDVVAHLIGWNRLMIQASASILSGDAPAYYADASNDYKNINAAFVQGYPSQSKSKLLSQLESSMQELETFILSLSPSELVASHSVQHYRGHPATIAGIIASLAGDYWGHADEINGWFAVTGGGLDG